jgi:hypothetical protein
MSEQGPYVPPANHDGTLHPVEKSRPKPYVCSQEPHPGVEFYGTDGGCAECDYRPATKPRSTS